MEGRYLCSLIIFTYRMFISNGCRSRRPCTLSSHTRRLNKMSSFVGRVTFTSVCGQLVLIRPHPKVGEATKGLSASCPRSSTSRMPADFRHRTAFLRLLNLTHKQAINRCRLGTPKLSHQIQLAVATQCWYPTNWLLSLRNQWSWFGSVLPSIVSVLVGQTLVCKTLVPQTLASQLSFFFDTCYPKVATPKLCVSVSI